MLKSAPSIPPPQPPTAGVPAAPKYIAVLLGVSLAAYSLAWCIHLYTATAALRGFFGDGALAFLIHLSHSYVFHRPGHLVHLFSVGFPRDFQLFLNALGLQAALWLDIRNPTTLKYIFVFWQFALPGFLYLGLFAALWRKGHAPWIVFPLISWAVLSVPVDWNAVNSTRWAQPIFWMHFYLVLFAGPKLKPWPILGALGLGLAMLAGLYESVMPHAALCLAVGLLLWWRQKALPSFLYALAAVPGALRALLYFLGDGHSAPNSFTGFALTWFLHDPYFFFIACTLGLFILLGLLAATGKLTPTYTILALALLLFPAANLLSSIPTNIWPELNLRFDYIAWSLALMAWAAALRILDIKPAHLAPTLAIVALTAGTILWAVQIDQTSSWQDCMTQYKKDKGGRTLLLTTWLMPFFSAKTPIAPLQPRWCLWDWATPWADLLWKEDPIESWTLLTFWQNFNFIKKDGATYLHTNNWTLTSPSILANEADLPLKTLLYDLTPLYHKLGDGPIMPLSHCMPPERSGPYWYNHLEALDDKRRALMNVCTRKDMGETSP